MRSSPVEYGIVSSSAAVKSATLPLDLYGEASWYLPNANQQGYYRWQVPAEDLRKMAAVASDMIVRILAPSSGVRYEGDKIAGGLLLLSLSSDSG